MPDLALLAEDEPLRDEYGHEWGLKIGVRISRSDALQYVAGLAAAGAACILGGPWQMPLAQPRDLEAIQGPGCYRCEMTFDECGDRECPKTKPADLDELRAAGRGHLAGLSRDKRRRRETQQRRAGIILTPPADSPRRLLSLARSEEDEAANKARDNDLDRLERSKRVQAAFDARLADLERKLERLQLRAETAIGPVASSRAARALAGYETHLSVLRERHTAANIAAVLLGGAWVKVRP